VQSKLKQPKIGRRIGKIGKRAGTIAALFTALSPSINAFASDDPDQLTERFKAWTVTCVTAEERQCRMVQELIQDKTGQRLSALIVEKGEAEEFSFTVLAPFGLAVSDGVSLAIDEEPLFEAVFATCMPSGCLVPLAADKNSVEKMKAGDTLTATALAAASGQPVNIEFSLQGFSAAHSRLEDLVISSNGSAD